MSTDSGKATTDYSEVDVSPGTEESDLPKNWKEAIPCLLSSRIAMIRAESKQAVSAAIGKIALLIVAVFCVIVAWLLICAGLVGSIVSIWSWQWYQGAFLVAGGHLLVAFVAVLLSRSKTKESFPITRAEFEKDREWLNQIKKQ